jgi:hypothetical protein
VQLFVSQTDKIRVNPYIQGLPLLKGLTMSRLFALIKLLFPHAPSQKERDIAYLNQSTDIYDIERRMQEIDSRPRRTLWPVPALQLGARS